MKSLNSATTQCSVLNAQYYVQTAFHVPFYAFLARMDGQTDKRDRQPCSSLHPHVSASKHLDLFSVNQKLMKNSLKSTDQTPLHFNITIIMTNVHGTVSCILQCRPLLKHLA